MNLKENNEVDNDIIYIKLLEAEKEMENTTIRYSVDEVLESMNYILKSMDGNTLY